MPRLPLGYVVTEEGVVPPPTTQETDLKEVYDQSQQHLSQSPPDFVLPVPTAAQIAAVEPHLITSEVMEAVMIEVSADELEWVPPPDEIPETIRLLMENWEYTQHEAEIFSCVLRQSIEEGMTHSDAVLVAEASVADHRAEIVRQKHLVGYHRGEPLVTMSEGPILDIETPETLDAREEAEDQEPECAVATPVMERVRRRRGDEKLVHVSTAVPNDVKKQLESDAEKCGMKLGAYVRYILEQSHKEN